jgi:outer membrane lipoprotein SlyB
VGAFAGPIGLALGGLAGALLGGLMGGAAGSIAGSEIGNVVDEKLLGNCECLQCGHVFSASSGVHGRHG